MLDKLPENRKYGTMGPPDPTYPLQELGQGCGRLRTPYGSKFYDILEPLVQAALLGRRKPKDALDEAYEKMIKIRPELAK